MMNRCICLLNNLFTNYNHCYHIISTQPLSNDCFAYTSCCALIKITRIEIEDTKHLIDEIVVVQRCSVDTFRVKVIKATNRSETDIACI